jgi:hypothetical protein
MPCSTWTTTPTKLDQKVGYVTLPTGWMDGWIPPSRRMHACMHESINQSVIIYRSIPNMMGRHPRLCSLLCRVLLIPHTLDVHVLPFVATCPPLLAIPLELSVPLRNLVCHLTSSPHVIYSPKVPKIHDTTLSSSTGKWKCMHDWNEWMAFNRILPKRQQYILRERLYLVGPNSSILIFGTSCMAISILCTLSSGHIH